MTKLMEWLLLLFLLLALYTSLITGWLMPNLITSYPMLVLYSPLYVLLTFGLWSASVVIYRTMTFNECREAAEELKRDIREAREDLTKKGFKFHQ